MKSTEIAWLSGLIDGEGCFKLQNNNLSIILQMTDEDVVRRAAKLMDCPVKRDIYNKRQNPKWKPVYGCALHGNRAAAWMMTLYTHMGARRRAKIREILDFWKTAKTVRRSPRKTSYYTEVAN